MTILYLDKFSKLRKPRKGKAPSIDHAPTDYGLDENMLKTNLLFKPKYVYKKSACQILGMTAEQFDHQKKHLKVPRECKRGSKIMYEMKEIEALLNRQGAV